MKDKKILTEIDNYIDKFFEDQKKVADGYEYLPFDKAFVKVFKAFLYEHFEQLLAKKMNIYEWRPFETAPKDREILVRYPRQMNVTELVSFDHIHGYWRSKGEPVLGIEAQGCLWTEIPGYKG